MILGPLNDHECLSKLSQRAAEAVDRPDVAQLAAQLDSTLDLAKWLRTLPQTDDTGPTAEGVPAVQCDVPQRARILAGDPNCVERSLTYLAVAEHLRPRTRRQLATIRLPEGLHTLPVEDGIFPIRLDPAIPAIALHAGVWAIRNARGLRMSPEETLRWIVDLADGEAITPRLRERVARAKSAIDGLLDGFGIPATATQDVAVALALAKRAASIIGEDARRNVARCAYSLDAMRRNVGFRFNGRKFRVNVDWSAVKTLGKQYGPAAAMAAATAAGVPLPVAAAVGAVVAQTLEEEKAPDAPQAQK